MPCYSRAQGLMFSLRTCCDGTHVQLLVLDKCCTCKRLTPGAWRGGGLKQLECCCQAFRPTFGYLQLCALYLLAQSGACDFYGEPRRSGFQVSVWVVSFGVCVHSCGSCYAAALHCCKCSLSVKESSNTGPSWMRTTPAASGHLSFAHGSWCARSGSAHWVCPFAGAAPTHHLGDSDQ